MQLLQLKESWNKQSSVGESLGHWTVLLPWTAYIACCAEAQWAISTLSSGLGNSPTESQEAQTPQPCNGCNDGVEQMQLPSEFQSCILEVRGVFCFRLEDVARHVTCYLTLALELKAAELAFPRLDWVFNLILVDFATGCLGSTYFIFCRKSTVQMRVSAYERVETTGKPCHEPCGRHRHSQAHCAAADSLGTKQGWLCSPERS